MEEADITVSLQTSWRYAVIRAHTMKKGFADSFASGFAIQAEDWRWAFWILLWLDGFCLIVLIFFFPETSSANILLRRARRLRKVTGNENLRSQSEIMASQMTGKQIVNQTVSLADLK
jgi:hypothetical protein